MINQLIAIREILMDKADEVLNSVWPDRTGTFFTNEMKNILNQMISLVHKMENSGIGELELSKTYSYIGQISSDLSPALGNSMLLKARDSYLKSEKLLQNCNDEMAVAKLNFNFANTLRQIDSTDIYNLLDAKRRLKLSEKYFSVHRPDFMPRVKEGLKSVDALIEIAPLAQKIESNKVELEEISNEIKNSKDIGETAEKLTKLINKDGGIYGLVGEFDGLINSMSNYAHNKKKPEDIMQQLNNLSSQAAEGSGQNNFEDSKIFDLLMKRLHDDIGNGKVDEAKAKILTGLLKRLEPKMSGDSDELGDILTKAHLFEENATSMFELTHYLSHGIPRPSDSSRASQLIEFCWLLRRFLLEEMSKSGKGAEESRKMVDLNIKGTQVDKHLYEAGNNDKDAAKFEIDELRPFSLEVRNLSARHYSMLAQPIWSVTDVAVDVKSVFFSGLPENEKSMVLEMLKNGYTFSARPRVHSFAESRWRQLQNAITCVFDFRSASGPGIAAISYELGIALALGKPVVIVANEDQVMPFDIETEPVFMQKDCNFNDNLRAAIEQSVYWTYPRPNGKPSLTTVNFVLNYFSKHNSNLYVKQTLKLLKSSEVDFDPLFNNNVLRKLINYADDSKTCLIHPLYPPAYPAQNENRVFHVTPFGPPWAAKTTSHIRKACKNKNTKYIRGDEAVGANVIQSIWYEIARASHIIADLTDLNANVALEIGIAHTLGRPTLLTGQTEVIKKLFPMIAKLRVIPYKKPEELEKITTKFLSEKFDTLE
jgi:nucleoside 2-deoxyribosyltransferase